jgi:hypothetical protein
MILKINILCPRKEVLALMSKPVFSQNSDSSFVRSPANLSQFIGPYGYVQCSCEKYPKITHINAQMIEYLGRAEKDSDLEEFLKENIFFTMIPIEERDVFKDNLEQALNSKEPIRVGHHIRCGDESLKYFEGWLSVITNENGDKEFAFIYILEDENEQSTTKENSYFNALKNTYDLIFEINFDSDTIECIYGKDTSNIGTIYDIVMTIDSGQKFWLNNYIIKDDNEMMTKYLSHICSPDSDWGDSTSIQCKFRLRWINNIVEEIFGVAIKLNSSTVLFCCKKLDNLMADFAKYDKESTITSEIPSNGVFIRTFGHFDVFVDGKPIIFTNSKEKELLALLVDRNGGTLTASEAITYLWEDEEVDERTAGRYRKLAMGLKNTLEKNNIAHILINHHGVRNIDVSAVICDYYELLSGNEKYEKMFHNLYMTDYSWAEETLATLWDYS